MRSVFIALSAIALFGLGLVGCDSPNNPATGPGSTHTYHTVTFETNGGSTVNSAQVREGQTVAVPTEPIKAGHAFVGWHTNASGNSPFNFNTAITEALTLHAHWVEVQEGHHLVRFITYGGIVFATVQVPYGNTADEPQNEPTREGHDFTAWYYAATGGSRFDFSTEIEAHISLYAGWDIHQFTVNFEMNGGIPQVQEQTVDWNGTATRPSQNPTRTNFEFDDWFAEGAETAFDFSAPITASIVLHARWTGTATFTVTFNSNGGSAVEAEQVVIGQTVTRPADPTMDNYNFAGWFTDDGTFNNEFAFTTAITGNITLFAQWVTIIPTVTFNSNGGSPVPAQQAPPEETANTIRPPNPLRAGHTFAGWFSDPEFIQAYNFGTPITANRTIHARWLQGQVSAGWQHTMAIRSDGSLWGWGNRAHNRLISGFPGTGASPQSTPIRVGIDSDWVLVSAGNTHTMAILANGALVAWGNRVNGILGLGTPITGTSGMARVGAANNWVAVSAGGNHTMGISADGGRWA